MTPSKSNKIFLLAVISLFAWSCSEDFSDNPQPNQPPETFISIFSENDLNSTISRQTLNWWGDDPDGIVVGFIYTFDANAPDVETWDSNSPNPSWTFTESRAETITLQLAGTDTVYTLQVKAVDDDGAADPTSAVQRFPIVNTRPVVEFPVGTDVPDTTFTIATFNWTSSDLDGDDSIDKYQWALDDSTENAAWQDVPATQRSITLTAADGLTEGEHVFYFRAIDIAGAASTIIRMPRDENDVWFVREPKSSFLVVDDYNVADNTGSFYLTALRSVVGDVDVWDIKSNSRALEPPSPAAFTQTLLLYQRIFWYADAEPNFEKAQVSIPEYLNQGGKIIMTTGFQEFTSNLGDPLEFSPVDSLSARINRITRNQIVITAGLGTELGFPELRVGTAIIPNIFPLVPKISSEILYVLPEDPNRWNGTPIMGVVDGTRSFVFMGLPIAALDGNGTASELIEKILNELF